MADLTNWLVVAVLCVLFFSDLRYDFSLPDVQLPGPISSVPWFTAAIAMLLFFFITMNSSS